MSTLLQPVTVGEKIISGLVCTEGSSIFSSKFKHVPKSAHCFKPKLNKTLKNKLKKYKLRKDGQEDQEILDVSQNLLSSLKIKSPTKQGFSENIEPAPKNYLFKMACKRKIMSESSNAAVQTKKETDVVNTSPSCGSQEKKQTNAFKLLMDSRNKSIGTNSPGKDKSIDESVVKDFIEKKTIKVKRNLALQKMAEAKGALQNIENEKYQDKLIQRKMEKRAIRLKKMITKEKPKSKPLPKNIIEPVTLNPVKNDKPNSEEVDAINNKIHLAGKSNSLQLINMFNETIEPNNISPEKKVALIEDDEFLKKLSPSMKKKENMLCYFKKIEKQSPVDTELSEKDCNNGIKIKFGSRMKKRIKKKKLRLSRNTSNDNLKENNNKSSHDDIENDTAIIPDDKSKQVSNDRKKRKRREYDLNGVNEQQDTVEKIETEIGRPKRSVRRPVKYIDDAQLSSSDEELHIFTPKKRKQQSIIKHSAKEVLDDVVNVSDDDTIKVINPKKKSDKEIRNQKRPAKLAPIFTCKPQLDAAELEAKQKFLYSGVPDQIKKIIAQKKSENTDILISFPVVVHVQQNETTACKQTPNAKSLDDIVLDDYTEHSFVMDDKNIFKQLLIYTDQKTTNGSTIPKIKNNTQAILKSIKDLYPKFPVYRTYRLLKDKRKGHFIYPEFDNSIEVINDLSDTVNDNPDNSTWANKYKPLSTNHLIGNFESVREMKKWLVWWTENDIKTKNSGNTDSDSSDFCYSDTDSRDTVKHTNNLLILSGPVGSGKTSSVYAVASDLAIKVIEVNVSSKRTGKVMLQDLQEATQSHKVNRGNGSTENSQKSQEIVHCDVPKHIKKRGRPKKDNKSSAKKLLVKTELSSQSSTSQQDNTRTAMSLILIDDADIVFDQDDGFTSAIGQLIQSSKRPVILVTSSLECPHLQRFITSGKIMNMLPYSPRMLGTWLDLMCLADIGSCWPGLGAKFLDYFKGDIRKTVNYLQYHMSSQTQESIKYEGASQNSDLNANADDENSSMSWADSEERNQGSQSPILEDAAWKCFINQQSNLYHLQHPVELFNIWWSVPKLLNNIFSPLAVNVVQNTAVISEKHASIKELEELANVMDTFSVCDYFSCIKPDTKRNIASQPWYSSESNSVSEDENMENFNRHHEYGHEIWHTLITGSIVEAQTRSQSEKNYTIDFPSMAVERIRNRTVSRHHNLTSFLNPSAVLDRRALGLDYWPTCRVICRIEKNKTDTVSKRNNRFCHYLKSLNVLSKTEVFDKLGDSLCSGGKET